ncbi:IS6 family transposase, partial [Bacillus thuringiensis]|nr:IS6 family transposase [Bacillus thuringiensis]
MVAVRYYCRFALSYRDVSVHPTIIMRWIHEYGSLIYQIWKKKTQNN